MNQFALDHHQKLHISDVKISKGFSAAGFAFGYSEEKIKDHYLDILKLIEHWKEQGFIEIVDVDHNGFRPYGVAKYSNKYPDQYKNLYHVRLTNQPDPLLFLKIEKDEKNPEFYTIKIITMVDHSKVFDNKDNNVMKNFVVSVIRKTEKY